MELCTSCKSADIVTDYGSGDTVCRCCGLILAERLLDEGAEWRTFTLEEPQTDPVRIGSAYDNFFSDGGLNTTIAGGKETQREQLQKTQNIVNRDPRDQRLLKLFERLQEMVDALQVPHSVMDVGRHVLKRCMLEGLKGVKGGGSSCLVAAALYVGCRQHQVPRSLQEVAQAAAIDKKVLGKMFLRLKRKTDLEVDAFQPENWLRRQCGLLHLKHAVVEAIIRVEQCAKDRTLNKGMNPRSLCAAAIYMVTSISTGQKRSREEIAQCCQVAASTVQHSYRLIHPHRRHLLTPDLVRPLVGGSPTSVASGPGASLPVPTAAPSKCQASLRDHPVTSGDEVEADSATLSLLDSLLPEP
mmetsp:Transcript_20825/g.30141  ORF Transcript_20825/g.30141 Transcript_20825/m.30141 type:complete len:356 (-) Transcript_20825:121-1188(-)|eukprot:CAMPEP_0113945852 /NCGR_PEP_ID=MMETSP1339-20121228/52405_1 /TAXON_ID=94617 /ORGANISM="Fibrocapsa japonica" /LENGTH=355 /DNA_ID=CAMNT_0000951675 /DNA_START=94 /DNA_END=1161 /DNA_ORIENTATION=+ /assembly_acc=CAM_ASM_000762